MTTEQRAPLPEIRISPVPTPEEQAAIVAAVTAAIRTSLPATPASAVIAPPRSRWIQRARREMLRGDEPIS